MSADGFLTHNSSLITHHCVVQRFERRGHSAPAHVGALRVVKLFKEGSRGKAGEVKHEGTQVIAFRERESKAGLSHRWRAVVRGAANTGGGRNYNREAFPWLSFSLFLNLHCSLKHSEIPFEEESK